MDNKQSGSLIYQEIREFNDEVTRLRNLGVPLEDARDSAFSYVGWMWWGTNGQAEARDYVERRETILANIAKQRQNFAGENAKLVFRDEPTGITIFLTQGDGFMNCIAVGFCCDKITPDFRMPVASEEHAKTFGFQWYQSQGLSVSL